MNDLILDYVRKVRKAFPGTRWYVSPRWSWAEQAVLPARWFHRIVGGTRNDAEGWVEFDQTHESIAAAVAAHPGMVDWPRDVVMLVAARAGEALLAHMEGIAPGWCRDCDAPLHGDTKATRTLDGLRGDRPIKFVCLDCVLFYNLPTASTGVVIDQRPGGK